MDMSPPSLYLQAHPTTCEEKKEDVANEFWENAGNVPNTGPNIPVGTGELKVRLSSGSNGKISGHILCEVHPAEGDECPLPSKLVLQVRNEDLFAVNCIPNRFIKNYTFKQEIICQPSNLVISL